MSMPSCRGFSDFFPPSNYQFAACNRKSCCFDILKRLGLKKRSRKPGISKLESALLTQEATVGCVVSNDDCRVFEQDIDTGTMQAFIRRFTEKTAVARLLIVLTSHALHQSVVRKMLLTKRPRFHSMSSIHTACPLNVWRKPTSKALTYSRGFWANRRNNLLRLCKLIICRTTSLRKASEAFGLTGSSFQIQMMLTSPANELTITQ